MTREQQVLIFAGSNREASLNRKVAKNAMLIAAELQVPFTALDLRDFPLPLYDGDLEVSGATPPSLSHLRSEFTRHPVWLISSPDYNSSVSPLLKNLIDWVSRPAASDGYLTCFQGKRIGLMSSSPGNSGGSRGLPHLRQVLTHLGARVHEQSFLVPRGAEAFEDDGTIREPGKRAEMRHFIANLLGNWPAVHVSANLTHALSATADTAHAAMPVIDVRNSNRNRIG
jgi:NAD(P)H-dependent FMN reductase